MGEVTPMVASQQQLSGAELLHRAQKLRPGLLARQAEAERLRRLPEVTIQEFHAAGILRAIQPVAFGGFETDFIDLIDIAFEIARACGASGWVYAVLGAHAAMLANFSERAQEEVWGRNPNTLAASSLTAMRRFKRVDGGYIVSGYWRYASGCEYCTYLIAGGEAEEGDTEGRRPRRRFLLPIAEMDMIDDWHVMGLAGTGSKSLRAQDLFIPEWRSLSKHALHRWGPVASRHCVDRVQVRPAQGMDIVTVPEGVFQFLQQTSDF
jgi:3-hydroxy-9,10-secoandrosta-1,3,5(10)-triene-9,17-dione monooxygenase